MPPYASPSTTNAKASSAARTKTAQTAQHVPPVVLKAAPWAAVVISAAVLRTVLRARRGSRDAARRRGLVIEGLASGRDQEDPFAKDTMRKYNVVKMPELTDEQVARARARRAREMVDFSFEDVEVPEDHPFATKSELTEEERETIRRNLNAESPSERRKNRLRDETNGDAGRRMRNVNPSSLDNDAPGMD